MPAEPVRILRATEQAILGGEQTDVLHLLAHLDPGRYVQVLCTEPAGPLVDKARALGIPHVPVTMRSRFDVAAIRRLRDIMIDGRYDLVHLHGARAGLLGRVAARLAGAPLVVWTMHVFQADVLQGWRRWQVPLYVLAESLLARHFCDQIITVSEELRQRTLKLEHVPPAKVATIYSHVELGDFDVPTNGRVERRELGLSESAPVVCTIGRMCIQKGMSDFIHAAARVHERMPAVRFLLVGDGPLLPELRCLAGQLGLNDCLAFAGHRTDVAEILLASDVFATATHWEGFGKVIVEAMAAGKPLVSTRVGPIPEVVGGYRGVVWAPPRNPRALADAMLTVLDALPRYAGWSEQDRRSACARFGRGAMIRHTSELYERLLAARAAGRVRRRRAPEGAAGHG